MIYGPDCSCQQQNLHLLRNDVELLLQVNQHIFYQKDLEVRFEIFCYSKVQAILHYQYLG